MWHVDPLPSNNCVNSWQYNSRCYGTALWTVHTAPHLLGGTEESHETPQSVYPVSWMTIELSAPPEQECWVVIVTQPTRCVWIIFSVAYLTAITAIKSMRMRWTGHVVRTEEKWNACMILVRKPEGKRPLGRPTCRRKDNGSYRNRMGWYELDLSGNTVMNLRVS
jgi:hypothetical protein